MCNRGVGFPLAAPRASVVATLLGVVAISLLLAAGCGGGRHPPQAARVPIVGLVTGFVYVPQGWVAPGDGTLEHTVVFAEIATPPPGTRALVGARVTIEDSAVTATTGPNGRFELRDVPPGPQAMRIDYQGASGLWRLTVVAGDAVCPGVARMTREEVLQLLQDRVLSGLASPETVLVDLSQQPLPAGTSVATEDPRSAPSYYERILRAPAWLALIDPYPGYAYGHPVWFALVDDATCALTVDYRLYWPLVNQIPLWHDEGDRVGPDMAVTPTSPPTAPDMTAAAFADLLPQDHIPECEAEESRWYCLFVQGNHGLAFDQAVLNMSSAFRTVLPDCWQAIVRPGATEEFAVTYAARFDLVKSTIQPCDVFFLYIAAHGASWVDRQKVAHGTPDILFERTDESLGFSRSEYVTPKDYRLGELRCCHIVVVQDTCFSGLALHEPAVGRWPDILKTMTGRAATVIASAGPASSARYIEQNHLGVLFGYGHTGSYFEREFRQSGLVGLGPDELAGRWNYLTHEGRLPVVAEQEGRLWRRPRQEGETCLPPVEPPPVSCTDEDELNNCCNTADPMGDSSCGRGTISEPDDIDHFSKRLAPGWWVVTLTESRPGMTLYVIPGPNQAAVSGNSPLEFHVPTEADVCIGILSEGETVGAYRFTITARD